MSFLFVSGKRVNLAPVNYFEPKKKFLGHFKPLFFSLSHCYRNTKHAFYDVSGSEKPLSLYYIKGLFL